ncbi:MAG: N-acetylglucosamine kinase, partial [Fusobacteriaceae bacterium]
KTKAILLDSSKKEIGKFIGGPMNFQLLKGEGVKNRVLEVIKHFGIDNDKTMIGVGVAGAGRSFEIEEIELALDLAGIKNFKVTNDAHIALLGAHGGEDGGFLISGTGSIGYFLNENTLTRVGGFGHILGDEGSGYWVGLALLKSLFKGSDNRGEFSEELLQKVLVKLSLKNRDELLKWVYSNKEKGNIASLARVVFENSNEKICGNIIEEAVEDLKNMILTLKKSDKVLKLSLGGGILENPTPIKKLLLEKLKENGGIEVTERLYTPEYGAFILIDKEFFRR